MSRFRAAVHHKVRSIMTFEIAPFAGRAFAFIGNAALLIALPVGALAFILQSL